MAFATWLPSVARSGSGLGRGLKAAITVSALVMGVAGLGACANNMGGAVGSQGGPEAGNGTVPNSRMARPDVNPIGSEGANAYGSPRSPSAGSGPLKVALLVPQSGRGKDLGDTLFDAAQMALFDTGRSDISLIVKDTSNGAGSAAQSAINDGAQIILGPVYSSDVGSVRAVAAPLGVPVIAFSSDTAAAGGGAYILSFPLEEEIRTVVNYSASRGMALFAVMSPADAYASRATSAFQRDVTAIGGQVVASATYSGGGPGYGSVMQLDNKDFDAIFIPGSGSSLRQIANLIKFGPPPPPAPPAPTPLTPEEIAAGKQPPPAVPPPPPPPRAVLPEYVLLGTGLWDEPGNGSAGGLVNGVFAAPDPYMHSRFADRFNASYGHRPASIASLGYDAMSLAATLSSGMPGQQFTAQAITDPNGFSGVDGIFRFLPNGTIQRGLAILQVTGGGFTVVKPAPSTFQTPGA